jgi:DNA-binding MarR family transcriptional regulator/GNAT superfamily N-acetyltransferase
MTEPPIYQDDPALPSRASAFRRFNRLYTRLIGTLDEGYHHTPFSLAETRVLYELATRQNPLARDIASSLNLDPGYLSRILRKLQLAGLLKRKISRKDNRSADLHLTARGRALFNKLNSLSEHQARGFLSPLTPAQQAQLIESMKTIEKLLAPPESCSSPIIIRSHRPGDMGWVVELEGRAYTEEYGWDSTFEALVARIVADFLENFDPSREHCWIAECDGQRVGHIFLVKHPHEPGTAKLRLLLVYKSARGRGLGQVLVNECIKFARSAGYKKITLWTQSILHAAHRLYVAAGFQLVKEEPHHSFGADLVGQTWELDLIGVEKTRENSKQPEKLKQERKTQRKT